MKNIRKIAACLMLCFGVSVGFAANTPNNPANDSPLDGNINFGVDYTALGGTVFTTKLSALLGDDQSNALAVELGIGKKELRTNVTYGHQFNNTHAMKVTDDYLHQTRDLGFSYLSYDEKVWQNALGAAYRYSFNMGFLDSLELSSYYSYSPSKNAKISRYTRNNNVVTGQFGYIVGAKKLHNGITASVKPWSYASLSVGGDYDYIKRDYRYQAKQRDHLLGGNAELEQVVFSWLKGSVYSDYLQVNQTYGGELSVLLPSPKGVSFELIGNFSYDHDKSTREHFYLTKATVQIGFGGGTVESYRETSQEQDFLNWVATPVVRMSEVIVNGEETTTRTALSPKAIKYLYAPSDKEIRDFEGDIKNYYQNSWHYVYSSNAVFDNATAEFIGITNDKRSGESVAKYSDKNGHIVEINYLRRQDVMGVSGDDWKPIETEMYSCKVSQQACALVLK